MTTVSLAVLVKVSAPLRQFLRVRSIQSIPISAQSVVLVQVFVPLRPSACPNNQGITENKRGCFFWSIPSFSLSWPSAAYIQMGPLVAYILMAMSLLTFSWPCRYLHPDGAMSHATGSPDCRQKCRERGYYHLHRQLNDPLFLHTSPFFSALRVFSSPPKLGGAGVV